MERKPEIRYINSVVCGSSAYQLEYKPVNKKKRVKLPKPRQEQKKVIALDPVAIIGIAVAVVLLVLLVVGFIRLQDARAEALMLEKYVRFLQTENQQLQNTYSSGYDLEEIEKIALAMGKIPVTQVPQISIAVTVPSQTSEPTGWESFFAFLTGLFA